MKWVLIAAGISGALSVIAGAAGAHMAVSSAAPEAFQTGLRYHQLYSIVLLVLGIGGTAGQESGKRFVFAAALFTAGIVFFSGSLYAASLLDLHSLTALTPVGGLCFIAGWIALAGASMQKIHGKSADSTAKAVEKNN